MYKIVKAEEKTISVHEAVKKIRDSRFIPVFKISFNKGAQSFYTMVKTHDKGWAWCSIFGGTILNGDTDGPEFYESIDSLLRSQLDHPCKDQHSLHLFSNKKEYLTWLLENI